ncbi:hypothetical protein G6F40_013993 [Rhizopus arrhizus]|nr:hypothetical protein G6F40_013993 [Rhizopus arrhizus]
MAGSHVQHAHRRALPAQALGSIAQQFLQVLATHADAAPADRIQIVAIDHAPQRALATGFVAVDVVQRAARIETGLQPQRDAFGQRAAEAQATAHHAPAQVGQAVALWRPRQDFRFLEGRPMAVRIASRQLAQRFGETRLDEAADECQRRRAVALAQRVVEEARQVHALLDRAGQPLVEAVLRAAMHDEIRTGHQQLHRHAARLCVGHDAVGGLVQAQQHAHRDRPATAA